MCWLSRALIASSVAAGSRWATASSSASLRWTRRTCLCALVPDLAGVDQLGDAADRVDGRVLRSCARRGRDRARRDQQVDAQRARRVGLRRERGVARRRRARSVSVAFAGLARPRRARGEPPMLRPFARSATRPWVMPLASIEEAVVGPHARDVAGDRRAAAPVSVPVQRRERRAAHVDERLPVARDAQVGQVPGRQQRVGGRARGRPGSRFRPLRAAPASARSGSRRCRSVRCGRPRGRRARARWRACRARSPGSRSARSTCCGSTRPAGLVFSVEPQPARRRAAASSATAILAWAIGGRASADRPASEGIFTRATIAANPKRVLIAR